MNYETIVMLVAHALQAYHIVKPFYDAISLAEGTN